MTRVAIMQDGELADFRIEKFASHTQVGRIFKGRVADVLPGMDAAFVNIGLEKNAYLGKLDVLKNGKRGQKLDRIKDLVKVGDEILVEVIKDESESKGAKVTMRLSLSGKNMVLMPDDGHVGMSRQIASKEDQVRLRHWSESFDLGDNGLIIRTSAAESTSEELTQELDVLLKTWEELKSYRVLGKSPQCIYQGVAFIPSVLRDEMKSNVDTIICNDKTLTQEIVVFLKDCHTEWLQKIIKYEEQVPIFEAFGVEAKLKHILSRRVELVGGSFLIIDETEALTVIDVNSGQHTGRKNMDHTAFKVNRVAAEMVARIIKIRELSGIILIDYIDMIDADMKKKLVKYTERLVIGDRNRVTVHGLTKLGILEMTRKKSTDSLAGRLMMTCSSCEGTRYLNAPETQIEIMIRELKYFRNHTDAEAVLYEVSDFVLDFIKDQQVELVKHFGHTGFKVILVTGNCAQNKRIKADSKEKLIDFAKKTGYLEVFHI